MPEQAGASLNLNNAAIVFFFVVVAFVFCSVFM